ncbi:hypothetical protein LguiB_012564 [Lonicera macranthoides]
MEGSSIDVDCEFTSPLNRTLVLVGRTGNGKSATGNSILQRKAFGTGLSSKGVAKTCEQQRTVLPDGMILNVIDTLGLFDFSAESEFIGKEIVKCIDMAKDGIHAALLVLSIRTRFSKEEEATIQSLQNFFGSKIYDYMIVVFTGGDELEDDETLEDYLDRDCPEPLKKILLLCENRRVLFDNKMKDVKKKTKQVQELLSLVDAVLTKNVGKPYTHDIFVEMKGGIQTGKDEGIVHIDVGIDSMILVHILERNRVANLLANVGCIDRKFLLYTRWEELVESKLRETARRLEQQLVEEQAARLKAKENAQAAKMKSNDEIRELRRNLQKAQRETVELRNRSERSRCPIL